MIYHLYKTNNVWLAEGSNATDSRSVLFGGAGSNPAPDTLFFPYGLMVRILPFQGGGRGSIPRRETIGSIAQLVRAFDC